jgi:glycosyltransferase involved in cell wall biosynthesis
MNSPVLSICIPTFNRGKLLNDLLGCLSKELKGKGDSVDIVICDNCSDDNTPEVVKSFQKTLNLKYFRNERNIGIAANILKVPSLATGEYCWIIGDDDLLIPGSIGTVLEILNNDQNLNGIVVGYTYEEINSKDFIKSGKTPVPFRAPIFSDTSISKKISRWEESFLNTDIAALHTSIVSCIFRRSLWIDCSYDAQSWKLEPALTSLESTFPHTLIWARMFAGKPVYFISRPLVYFFVGEQDWFQTRWGAMLFSFCLELAQYFKSLGCVSKTVIHYENAILKHGQDLYRQIVHPNDYSKKHFSLKWLLKHYGRYPVMWDSLCYVIRSTRGVRKSLSGVKIASAALWHPSCWANFLVLWWSTSKPRTKKI